MPSPPEPFEPLPRPTAPGLPALFSVGLLALTFPTLGAAAQLLHLGAGLWFTEVVLFFGLPFAILRFSGRDPIRFTGLRFPGLVPPLVGLFVGSLNYFAAVVPLQYLSTSILPERLLQKFDQTRIFAQPTAVDLAVILSGVLCAAPVGEEFFFRGILQRALLMPSAGKSRPRMKPIWAVAIAGLVFSAFHFDPVGFLARFELGMLFGLLALRSGSLWPGILAHAANNGISSALFFLTEESASEEPVSLWPVVGISLIGVLGLLAAFALVRRYPHWLKSAHPAEEAVAVTTLPMWRLCLPWLGAGALILLPVFAFDLRGVKLNVIDHVKVPLEPLSKEASEEQKLQRGALVALRAKARRGELPIELYEQRRRALQAGTTPRGLTTHREPTQEARDHGEEAVEVHLAVPQGQDGQQLEQLEEKITQAISDAGAGTFEGKESSPSEWVLYFHGPSAKDLADSVRATLKNAQVPKGSYLQVRPGGKKAQFRREPL